MKEPGNSTPACLDTTKWPKTFPPLTPEQEAISNDFMKHWHEILASGSSISFIETFNHGYVLKNCPYPFVTTLEIGAGLGEHLKYEKLTEHQAKNYVAVEIRENMAEKIKQRNALVQVHIGDCQERLPFADNHFNRIIAIHVLEHLPNLPATIKEMYRVCHKKQGFLSVVIPCEGGFVYGLGRKISAQRIFEKRYKQSYKWLIEREHINLPDEIISELKKFFELKSTSYFPCIIPSKQLNLFIGLTLLPKMQVDLLEPRT